MKRLLFLVIIFMFFAQNSRSQNYNWITPNKTYLKMFVADDGIYRIDKSDFTNAGINTTGLNPKTVKVYNKGIQIPVYFEGESDDVFDINDYLDFYGTRNYGGLTKTYSEDNVVKYTTNEYFNLYSDTNVYWIDWGGANGLRMQISNYSSSILYSSKYFYDVVHREKDKYYFLGESLPVQGGDYRNFTNENFLGEGWYWSLLNNFGNVNNLSVSDTFSIPLLYNISQNATIRIFAYPYNVNLSIFNEHSLQIKVNGILVSTITINDYKRIDTTITFSSSLLFSSGMNTATATYAPAAGFETVGAMNFDLFEIQYPKFFKFRNNQSFIILSGTDSTSRSFNLSGYVPANPVQIYDVINGIKINAYTSNLDTLKFTGKSNSKFEVVNKNITKKPFRIIQKQVPNYVSNSNGVDYLLIYNSIFSSQASQLKSYRENSDNFRVTSVDIQNIYDIFNYGLEGPAGLKNFTKYVYDNWQLPKVKYICLMGRGSLDPKKNSSTTVYSNNLIPVIGNPTSDNYFTNFTGSLTYYNQISIGRMSAYTPAEAQYMINNIITYETQIPQDWWKSFTFIAGGADSVEQSGFIPFNDTLINPYVIPPPVSGNPVKIYRNDFNGGFTYNFSDSIKNQINRGTMTVNFIGHAGSQDWEIGMSDPNILSNSNGRFPLIFSMTCYTGKIGDPNSRIFGERFMTMNNKGAIGYVGTSGWGFVYAGSLLNNNMMKSIAKDSVRRLGDILSYATKNMSHDSLSFTIRHTINCYTLQGDPAVKLRLPKVPEYSISNNDYKLSNNNPIAGEPVTLTVYPKNFGLYSDSCKIRFQLNKDFTNYLTKDTVLRNFKYSDSIKYNFMLNTNDTYNAAVILDYTNSNPTEYRLDNVLNFSISTKNIAYLPLKPVNNSVVRSDSVVLTGLNPFLDISKNNIKLLLELDTTKNFNSILKQSFVNSAITGTSTKFKTALPRLDTNILYYWRTNSIINNDSSGWSSYQIFRYLPALPALKSENAAIDSLSTIYKNKSAQFSDIDFNNTNFSSDGIRLNEFTGNIYVRSYGSNGAEASYFNVLNRSVHIDAGENTGLNLLKVRKLDGAILQLKNFKMTFANSSDSILNYLNTFDSTHILLGLNASFQGNTYLLNANTINKFAQFGSTQVQNFRIGFFDTWSFIGYLNAPPSEVSETIHRFQPQLWVESISSVNRTFKRTNGTVSFMIGPAQSWKDFSWQNTLLPSNNIKFDVYGIDRTGLQHLLLSNLNTNTNVNLSFINAYQYPNLNLLAKLNIDTVVGLQSPVLNSFKLNYTPPAEIVPSLSSYEQSDTSSTVGMPIKIKFDYHNSGNVNLPGVIVNFYKTSLSSQNLFERDTIFSQLKVDSVNTYYKKLVIPYIRYTGGKARIIAEVLPLGPNNEFYTFNNAFDFYLTINTYTNISDVAIYADGQLIRSGDFVRKTPEIKIEFKNLFKDKGLFSDTSKAILQLNNSYVPYYLNGSINTLFKISGNENADQKNNNDKMLYFYPSLNEGENLLKIMSKNEFDNIDTSEYTVIVSNELFIKEFYNYPNPMKDETSFIVNISGAEIPLNSKIKIYTVSGRLIKEINYAATIGYNQIAWDGRDNDGDAIANGTYLYKFVTDDNSKKETAIQKLVVLR
ncbi:MAG: C25 family cysteine peptidase [bacterium]